MQTVTYDPAGWRGDGVLRSERLLSLAHNPALRPSPNRRAHATVNLRDTQGHSDRSSSRRGRRSLSDSSESRHYGLPDRIECEIVGAQRAIDTAIPVDHYAARQVHEGLA